MGVRFPPPGTIYLVYFQCLAGGAADLLKRLRYKYGRASINSVFN
jgi:hypothetical protein